MLRAFKSADMLRRQEELSGKKYECRSLCVANPQHTSVMYLLLSDEQNEETCAENVELPLGHSWGVLFDEISVTLHEKNCLTRIVTSGNERITKVVWPTDGEYGGISGKWSVRVNACGILDDWEMIHEEINQTSSPGRSGVQNGSVHSSYMQMLLKNKDNEEKIDLLKRAGVEQRHNEGDSNKKFEELHWKPKIVVTPCTYLHSDRKYGESNVTNVDDDGLWDLIDAVASDKASHSVTRVRGFTMLRPAALEKKNQRIQEKLTSRLAQGLTS